MDSGFKKPEEGIADYENKSYSESSSHKKGRYHPKERQVFLGGHGRLSAMVTARIVGASHPTTPPGQPRISHLINDNYYVASLYVTQLAGDKETLEE